MSKTSLETFAVTVFRRPSVDSKSETAQELLKGVNLDNPLFEGHVFKQKDSNSLTNTLSCFNRRYFILFPGIVLYYEHKRDYLEDLKFGMRRYKVLKLNGLYLTSIHNNPTNARFCINLHLPDPFNKRHEMLLAFHTRKQKRQWMGCLQRQNPKLVRKENT